MQAGHCTWDGFWGWGARGRQHGGPWGGGSLGWGTEFSWKVPCLVRVRERPIHTFYPGSPARTVREPLPRASAEEGDPQAAAAPGRRVGGRAPGLLCLSWGLLQAGRCQVPVPSL